MTALDPGTTLQGGNFVIVSQLGEGGFGAVYLARQGRLERDVAIKVLHPHHAAREDIVVRFRREALAAASLSHPNVLPVFDFDYDPDVGLWFLAMQYVRSGHSLEEMPTPLERGLTGRIITGVASAMDAAHARGIVHRDVKPANVLLDGEHPLLTDFGIAHLSNVTSLTGIGMAIGTPVYMSPEQALGREIGARSDQYSLAVMTYELLVGRPPFHGDAPAVLYQHVHEPVPRPETPDGIVPDAVAEAVLRAMRKQPDERFATCTDFATALRAATTGGGQPVRHAPTATVTAEATPPGTRPAEPASSALTSPAPAASTIDAAAETARPIWSATPRLAAGGAAALIVVTIAAMILVAVQRPKPPADAPPIGSPAVASVGAGTVLLADSFDDAAGGFLPASAPDGAPFRLGYVDGEYEIAGPRGGFVALPGTLRDSSMAVDARLVGDPVGRAIGIACRASEQGWYQVTLQPDTRSFSLAKFSFSDAATVLIPDQTSPAILRGNAVNHLELACARTTLAATANGSLLGSVEDDTYREGWFQISVLGTGNVGTDEIALRLDNLVVSQR